MRESICVNSFIFKCQLNVVVVVVTLVWFSFRNQSFSVVDKNKCIFISLIRLLLKFVLSLSECTTFRVIFICLLVCLSFYWYSAAFSPPYLLGIKYRYSSLLLPPLQLPPPPVTISCSSYLCVVHYEKLCYFESIYFISLLLMFSVFFLMTVYYLRS